MKTTMTIGQLQSFLRLADEKGVTPKRMTGILSSGVLADVFDASADLSNRDDVRRSMKLGRLLPPRIVFTVDYGTAEKPRTLKAMIAAGRYDWKDDNITAQRFPITDVGRVEMEGKIFHFNRDIYAEEAELLIKADDPSNPWVVAKIEHLLTFGELFPDEQRKYPISALGSVAEINGNRYVSYLSRDGSRRDLCLGCHDFDWGARCRFLAVRKVSSSAT